METKKQTAVHWLLIAMTNKLSSDIGPQFLDLFDQALEMEKEQMKDAVLAQSTKHEGLRKIFDKQFEQYYTSTYGQ